MIQSARNGDIEAFNCLVLACQDLVFQYAHWMLRETEAAEDLAQETFRLAYREFRSFQDDDIHIRLLRIASRLCLEELRLREQDQSSPLGMRDSGSEELNSGFWVHDLTNSAEGKTDQYDLKEIIWEGLRNLSLDHRAVITLVDIQGMDYRKTAEILGISEGFVNNHLARARVQIRTK